MSTPALPESEAEKIRTALTAHADAVTSWGASVTGMLQTLAEQVAELEGRVSRIEKRIRFLDAGRSSG